MLWKKKEGRKEGRKERRKEGRGSTCDQQFIYLFIWFSFAKIHTMATKENPVKRVQRILFYILFTLFLGWKIETKSHHIMVEGRNKGGLMKSPYLDYKTIMGVLEGFCQNKARIFLFFNIKKRK